MASIAVYNMKGGVGKTTMAVNLAWCAAAKSARETLLWDLDPQGAASFIMGNDETSADEAQAVFSRKITPEELVQATEVSRLDLLAADSSLRSLDRFFFDLNKKRRLRKLLKSLGHSYDRIVLDCAPGLAETSEQILRAADVIIVPLVPSTLSQRALEEVQLFLNAKGGKHAPLLPVYSMVDRRRKLHLEALEKRPDWPVIPMASSAERMAALRQPLGICDPKSPAAEAYANLWTGIERQIDRLNT